jgi:threonine/homoserine/homoserine lactone efflux protein
MNTLVPVSALIPFFVASLAIELTPGPNMAYLALVGAQKGRVTGFYATAGVALGLLVIGVLAALGVAVFVAQNRFLYEMLRWGGVMYLFWLAYDSWREAQLPPDTDAANGQNWNYFGRGLITNLLNPKAFLFYLAVLPNFTNPATMFWPQAILLTFVYVGAATLVHLSIVFGAGSVSHYFAKESFRRVLGGVFAALLIAVAMWLATKSGWSAPAL